MATSTTSCASRTCLLFGGGLRLQGVALPDYEGVRGERPGRKLRAFDNRRKKWYKLQTWNGGYSLATVLPSGCCCFQWRLFSVWTWRRGHRVFSGFHRLEPLFQPLYDALLVRNAQSAFAQADETRWMVFIDLEGRRDIAGGSLSFWAQTLCSSPARSIVAGIRCRCTGHWSAWCVSGCVIWDRTICSFPGSRGKKTWLMVKKDLERIGIPYENPDAIADFTCSLSA